MSERFRKIDAAIRHCADVLVDSSDKCALEHKQLRDWLLELRGRWQAENHEVEATFDTWAPMQCRIEELESALAETHEPCCEYCRGERRCYYYDPEMLIGKSCCSYSCGGLRCYYSRHRKC